MLIATNSISIIVVKNGIDIIFTVVYIILYRQYLLSINVYIKLGLNKCISLSFIVIVIFFVGDSNINYSLIECHKPRHV